MTSMLALVGEAYGGAGGIAQYNRDLFGALAASGRWRIQVLPRHGGDHPTPPPRGLQQERPRPGRLGFSLHALSIARRTRPDVVFCGHLFMAPLAAHVARQTRAKLLIQLHGIEAWDRPSEAIRKAVREADLVACVSRDTRARLLDWSAMAPERAVVISNTVAAEFSPGDRAKARARFGLSDEAVLLSVGRLDSREKYKGQDRVIAALPELLAQQPDVLYLIAGEGDDRPRLERLAAQAGVTEQVRFLGAVPYDALADLYRAADLFALPSTREGFGIVFLEAMACGAPALGLAEAGASDPLADGELGLAVAPAGLVEGLLRGLAEPRPVNLSARMLSRFGPDAFQARINMLFERLLAAPSFA